MLEPTKGNSWTTIPPVRLSNQKDAPGLVDSYGDLLGWQPTFPLNLYHLGDESQGRCWMEGDNPSASGDSRNLYGPVSASWPEGSCIETAGCHGKQQR